MEDLREGDPESIGPYRLEARLGEGGMGRVFLGTSPEGDKVAVKLLRSELAGSSQFRARFAREVAAARQVSGLHTAHLIGADPQADPPWLATAYIPGRTLHEAIRDDGTMPPDAVRALGSMLARGLADIHARGLIHRDLKPSNVIMAEDGPKIIDFGIARVVDSSTLTATGTVIGTYAYMSPEQIVADTATAASDVFALGCLLAYAATAVSPFDGTTVPATIHRILGENPDLGGIPPGELRNTIATCMAKDPGRRPSAMSLVERLAAVPGESMPGTVVDPGGTHAWTPGYRPGFASPPTFVHANGVPSSPPGAPWTAVTPVATSKRVSRRAVLVGGLAILVVMAVSATFLWLNLGRSDADGTLTVESERRITASGDLNDLAFSYDGKILASASGAQGDTELWDVDTGARTKVLEGTEACALAFSPDSTLLATGGCAGLQGGVQLWDVRTGQRIYTLTEHFSERLAFSPDSKSLGTVRMGSADVIELWSTESGAKQSSLDMEMTANRIAFSPDGGTLAVHLSRALENDHIELWNVRTGERIKSFTDENMSGPMFFSPDGRTLTTVSSGGAHTQTVSRWDLEAGTALVTVSVFLHFDRDFSADRETFVTAGEAIYDGSRSGTFIWSMDTGSVTRTLTTVPTFDVAYSPAGNAIASSIGTGSSFFLWTLG